MREQAEHTHGPGVVRVIELVGVSEESWADAARQAVARAAQTIRHITGVDVVHQTAVVRDGKIAEYHVDVKLAFIVEPALASANGIDVLAQDYATG
jgi:flavin-binding protein dodecin